MPPAATNSRQLRGRNVKRSILKHPQMKPPHLSARKTPMSSKADSAVTGRSPRKTSAAVKVPAKDPGVSHPPITFESIVLDHLNEKQRSVLSKEFRDKIAKIGKSLVALAAAKKDFTETDAKVAQLEETYGKAMKIQDVWQHQERAGLAAIIGQDPQSVLNTPHLFKDDQRLMYYSIHPRNRNTASASGDEEEEAAKTSPARSSSSSSTSAKNEPTRVRTRLQISAEMHNRHDRLGTDDEDEQDS